MNFFILLSWLFACSSNSNNKRHEPQTTSTTVYKDGVNVDVERKMGISKPTARVNGSIIERHKQIGGNPADTIALWIEASIRAQNNEKEGWEALKHLTIPLKELKKWKSHSGNRFFVDRIKQKNHCFKSFVVGANPENGYEFDFSNIRIRLEREGNKSASGRKFFITSSGSDMARPVHLKQSDQTSLFYVNEYSSLYVDVKPPVDPDKETFH